MSSPVKRPHPKSQRRRVRLANSPPPAERLRGIDRRLQRCPACNPLHSPKRRNPTPNDCLVCGGTKIVRVDVAARYLQALREI